MGTSSYTWLMTRGTVTTLDVLIYMDHDSDDIRYHHIHAVATPMRVPYPKCKDDQKQRKHLSANSSPIYMIYDGDESYLSVNERMFHCCSTHPPYSWRESVRRHIDLFYIYRCCCCHLYCSNVFKL